ncbi:DUF2087 domain-containing protein [Amycolatopsis thermophila]|uniref:DUF2087 domain-containing protein n=1 Tax=Amycolatopsis thermophila TaxID=206084 RepID=A0ABU0EVX6_9PSEU|nr:DUF2087 domain-containing protein [Amycolatopsis thermophila]MDQ0379116.1 hypothetical protein [Amycolatopsis thermophila]
MPSPEALVSALADPDRLLLFARICTAPDGLLPDADRQSAKHVKRLVAAGLVTMSDNRYRVVPEVFREALAKPPADPLEALFSRGRLVAIPRPGKLRRALLAHLAEKFEPGRLYTERDVREKLAALHDDHATLRRYLVDEGLLQRSNDGGTYGRPAEAR